MPLPRHAMAMTWHLIAMPMPMPHSIAVTAAIASFLAPVTPTTTLVGVTSQPYILIIGGWVANNQDVTRYLHKNIGRNVLHP